MLTTHAFAGGITIRGLAGGQLAGVVAEFPGLGYAAAHAATEAMRDGSIVITTDIGRYADVPASSIAL